MVKTEQTVTAKTAMQLQLLSHPSPTDHNMQHHLHGRRSRVQAHCFTSSASLSVISGGEKKREYLFFLNRYSYYLN